MLHHFCDSICDDCCGMGQSKASSLAQIYNFIWALDPYHITTGAVNCGTSWTWSDVPSLDAPTTNLSDAAIAEGQQPLLQLSIDYILHENYGRAFSDHECDGFWAHCLGGDGELRKGVPFEPVVNCLGRNSYGTERSGGAAEEKFASLAYLGVVEAGMIDQVTFADPIRSENTAAAKIAQEFLELRPSLQGEFGKHYPLTSAKQLRRSMGAVKRVMKQRLIFVPRYGRKSLSLACARTWLSSISTHTHLRSSK